MVEVPMTKVPAFKMVPFVASPHRHLDWWACVCVCVCVFVCVGACVRTCAHTYIHSCTSNIHRYLMWILFISMVGYGVHDEDEPLWLLPALQRTRHPAQQIGTYIKNLLPVSRGGSADYKAVSVPTLPENPSAAGLRKGFLHTINGKAPDKHMCTISGHSTDDAEHRPIINSYRPLVCDIHTRMNTTHTPT
jgi:hypothetical protein